MELNKVLMIGRLGHSPEGKDAGGSRLATFNICSNRRWKSKSGEQEEETCWIGVKAWGKTAELCERFLQRGSEVLVEGHLEEQKWDDKDTGKKRTRHVIVADRVQFGAKPKEDDGQQQERQQAAPQDRGGYTPPQPAQYDDPGTEAQYDDPGTEAQGDDDLPF